MRQQGYWQVKGPKAALAASPQLALRHNRESTWPNSNAGCRQTQRIAIVPVSRWGLFNRCIMRVDSRFASLSRQKSEVIGRHRFGGSVESGGSSGPMRRMIVSAK
jgi:hypothetical protein